MAMSFYGCAAGPRKDQRRRRRTSIVPTRIQVAPSCFSASHPATQGRSSSPPSSCITGQSSAPADSLAAVSDAPVASACAIRTVKDERASSLSSFLSRAQQLESKLLRQQTAALARDIGNALDIHSLQHGTRRSLPCSRHECDRAPRAADQCYVKAISGPHRGFWSQGCTVVQLVQKQS